ncbi:TPA: phage tail protein [Escherichia coli]|nr:phage tail protein [Escherichia coli]
MKTAAQRDVGTGANQIPDMSAWASGPGWRRTPDGFIEQFGGINFPSSGGAATSTLVAFPIPFPTGNIDTLVVYDGGFGRGNMWGATDWSGTGFTAHCNSDGEGARYFARGK